MGRVESRTWVPWRHESGSSVAGVVYHVWVAWRPLWGIASKHGRRGMAPDVHRMTLGRGRSQIDLRRLGLWELMHLRMSLQVGLDREAAPA
jgi:hypothetical protein